MPLGTGMALQGSAGMLKEAHFEIIRASELVESTFLRGSSSCFPVTETKVLDFTQQAFCGDQQVVGVGKAS